MSEAVNQAAGFRVGAVFGQSFGIFGKNIVSFGLIGLAFSLPSFGLQLITLDKQITAVQQQPGAGRAGISFVFEQLASGGALLGLLQFLLALMLFGLTQGALVYGTVRHLRGQPVGIGRCIVWALGVALPVLGVIILQYLAFILPALLAVAVGILAGAAIAQLPGMMISTTLSLLVALLFIAFLIILLCVAVPATVIERPGVIGSLRRSISLTRGHRWRILGIGLVTLFLLVLITVVISMLIGLFPFGSQASGTLSFGDLIPALVLNWLLATLMSVFVAVLLSVIYYRLRVAKEGADIDQIAAVFD